jgi:hypothetical protein
VRLLHSRQWCYAGVFTGGLNMESKLVVIALACAALVGCATKPEAIAPSYVSTVPYETWTCKQLTEETVRVEQALATASAQQSQARSNDIAGVLLIGLPVSTMSGENVAPQIASLKGQRDAVAQTMIRKNCSSIPAAPPGK